MVTVDIFYAVVCFGVIICSGIIVILFVNQVIRAVLAGLKKFVKWVWGY